MTTTPNRDDAERELRRVEEIERNKMQDRTKAIVEAAEALCEHVKIGLDVKVGEVPRITYTHTLDDLRRLSEAVALPAEPAPSSDRSTVERLDTLRQLVDLTHKNAVRSLQETSRCVQESLAEIRSELGTPASAPAWTKTPPSEPGLYFLRVPDPRGKHRIKIGAFNPQQGHGEVSFIGGDLGVPLAELNEHEWWPVPIQPPEET